jgi:integrase
LYREVLHTEVGPIQQVPRARLPGRLPIVLGRQEVGQILAHVAGTMWIVVALLYGAGLRLKECLPLRVKDIDFDRNQIIVRRGKGQKDRLTMLPRIVREPLIAHLREVKRLHDRDLATGFGRVVLPFALDRKYPNAATEWGWQFVFPASRVCRDPQWGPPSRFHLEGPLATQIAAFARYAREEGYALQSRYRQVLLAAGFSRWLGHQAVRPRRVSSEHPKRYLRFRARRVQMHNGDAAALRQFLGFLRRHDVIRAEKVSPSRLTPVEQEARAFEHYLRNERALARATCVNYVPFVRGFLINRFGRGPVALSRLV